MNSRLDFWRGNGGDQYIDRNPANMQARIALWLEIVKSLPTDPRTVLEVGANIGQNIEAFSRVLDHDVIFHAVEPNEKAREYMITNNVLPRSKVFGGNAEALPFNDDSIDLVFTSGVLIHIHPDDLLRAYRDMYRVARRYIISIEYFSVEPREKVYRGEMGRLWTRDFGQLWLDHFNMEPLGCGFAWKPLTGLDNLTWWVFKK